MNLCGFDVGLQRPFFLIAGPCVIESEQLQMDVAGQLKEIAGSLGIPFIFKAALTRPTARLAPVTAARAWNAASRSWRR
jgi:2-dehydro-3-deoxyphosphooctonate aldolase (KDO 8-P synthase)